MSSVVFSMTLICLSYLAVTSGRPNDDAPSGSIEFPRKNFYSDGDKRDKVTMCPVMRKYLGSAEAKQDQAEAMAYRARIKIGEEAAKIQYEILMRKQRAQEEKERQNSWWYNFMMKIPILNRYVREAPPQRYRREVKPAGFRGALKNVYEEGKKSLKQGIKNSASSLRSKLWEAIVPQDIHDYWPKIKIKAQEYWEKIFGAKSS